MKLKQQQLFHKAYKKPARSLTQKKPQKTKQKNKPEKPIMSHTEQPSATAAIQLTSPSQALSTVKMNDGQGHCVITEDWTQGRSAFGGLGAAMCIRAMRDSVAEDRPLRSMLVSFVGPVAVGTADISVNLLRAGRSASQAEAKLSQEAQVCTAVQAAFAGSRDSVIHTASEPRPMAIAATEAPKMPYLAGITPAFTQHADYYLCSGQFPMTGSKQHELGGWFRFKNIDGLSLEELIVLLSDAWPPTSYQQLKKPAAVSTISWALELTGAAHSAAAEGLWYFHSDVAAASNGYAQQRSRIWSPAGDLVAINQQTVALFA